MDEVILEKVNRVGLITLNRPKQLNALNLPMVNKILPKLREWQNDSNISMILIRGTGNTAFCAGGDIKSIRESALKGNERDALDFFKNEYILNYEISQCRKPYVALIHGVTMGGGVGLSVHGKYRIATEKTLFAMPETAIGFYPDVGGAYALSCLNGKLGLFLGLTGNRLKGKEVYDVGIATHYINSSQIEDITNSFLKLESNNPNDVKNLIETFSTESRSEFKLEHINKIFSGNTLEDVLSNLRNENSEWSNQQLKTLAKMSPTSLKVTFKYINLASSLSLKQVLQTDYVLSRHFARHNDFFEGVRALLVDKDNKPNWKPSSVEQVDDKKVDLYFQPSNDADNLDNLQSHL